LRCMLARNRSFVSCNVACSPASTCPLPMLARIEATAGLQTAQPVPVPCLVISSLNVVTRVAWTISNSSARDCGKCSHSAFDCSTPHADSSLPSIGTHDPHDVPARVHPLIAPTLSQPSSTIALLMAPFVTALQEQIWASSGSASTPTALSPPPAGPISAAGSPGSSLPTSGRRSVYSLAPPTSTPPSSVLASSETTSFLYDPATASLTTTSSAPSVAA